MSVFICENCNKEFQVGYGTNRFCSRSCCASFNAKKYDPEKKLKSLEKARAAKRHYNRPRKDLKDSTKGNCRFCNKECKNANSLRNHERFCRSNPNREESHLKGCVQKGHKGYNQYTKAKRLGLPKPEMSAETRYKHGSGTRGKHLSEERKAHLSKVMKEKIAKGEFIPPYKRNHSSKVSYPEKYFIEVFKDIPVKYNFQVGLYQLDFAIPEKKIYVEVDGEQHYVDKKIIEHDKIRTEKLEELGWTCIRRIRWTEYKKLAQEDREKYCAELISELS